MAATKRHRRWTEDERREAFAFCDSGQPVKALARKLGIAMTQAYQLIAAAEKLVGRRAKRPQKGTRATKTVGWTSGDVRSGVNLCACSSCVAARPERAALRKVAL